MNNTTQQPVALDRHNQVGIISIDYPPVNALSQQVRSGLIEGIVTFENDPQIKVIVIRCAQKTFIAGADIKEFGLPPTEPFLPEVVNRIEASAKPVIASMFGTTLGGGFEVALACHYRVALDTAKVGLPEVNLGLIPGAGGTQRLPRIVGAATAFEMVTSGRHYAAPSFADSELFDVIIDSTKSLDAETLAFAEMLIKYKKLNPQRVGEKTIDEQGFDWTKAIALIAKKSRGKEAPVIAAQVLFNTRHLPIAEGMAVEREAFLKLRESAQSAALRFAFGAEKLVSKNGMNASPKTVKNVGIIGGGNMGSGIVTAFLVGGFQVTLIEQSETALTAGVTRVLSNFSANVKQGRMSQQQADVCQAALKASVDYAALNHSDLVIEAIFEDIQVKKDLFAQLSKICPADCILATNTSYLDINEIASVVENPKRMLGMHFFSPANVMKLLEVVKARQSSDEALVTAMEVGKRLGKVSVLVGVCFGFAGNRMYTRYGREIQQMLLEGASIEQIDSAMTDYGMAMGPLAVQDLSGIDIGHNARSAQPFPEYDPGYFRAAAVMVENDRLGRKTGKGFYRYDENGKAQVDSIAQSLIHQKAQTLNIPQKSFSNKEIVERALLALISEGLSLLKENIVQRASDIDVIWLHGYGFPRHKGGPMYQAGVMGLDKVGESLEELRNQFGDKIWPQVDLSSLS